MKFSLFTKQVSREPLTSPLQMATATAYMQADCDESLRLAWTDNQLEQVWERLSQKDKRARLEATRMLAQPVRIGAGARGRNAQALPGVVRDLQRVSPAEQSTVLHAAVRLFGDTEPNEGHLDKLLVELSYIKEALRPEILSQLLVTFAGPSAAPSIRLPGYQPDALADRRLRTLQAILSGGPRAQSDKVGLLGLFKIGDADTLSQYRLAATLERLRSQNFESGHFAAVNVFLEAKVIATLTQAQILLELKLLAASSDPAAFAQDTNRRCANYLQETKGAPEKSARAETSALDSLGRRGPSVVGPASFS